MKLRRREFCPIHKSLFCCGRAKPRTPMMAVLRIEDPHHPRIYYGIYQRGPRSWEESNAAYR